MKCGFCCGKVLIILLVGSKKIMLQKKAFLCKVYKGTNLRGFITSPAKELYREAELKWLKYKSDPGNCQALCSFCVCVFKSSKMDRD